MTKTPDAEDAKVLRFAGVLGHHYALVSGEPGERRAHVEFDDERHVERFWREFGSRRRPRIYRRRITGEWRRVR